MVRAQGVHAIGHPILACRDCRVAGLGVTRAAYMGAAAARARAAMTKYRLVTTAPC